MKYIYRYDWDSHLCKTEVSYKDLKLVKDWDGPGVLWTVKFNPHGSRFFGYKTKKEAITEHIQTLKIRIKQAKKTLKNLEKIL